MNPIRPRLVVLGTGFGAFDLVKNLKDDYDIIVVSPRNHFLFTAGILDFRLRIDAPSRNLLVNSF